MIDSTEYDLTLPIPLTLKAHDSALMFYQQHSDARKAKQVYLNTLAIDAVRSYLSWLGIATGLQASDSWNPTLQALADVADLEIPGQGRLECRPVLPGATNWSIIYNIAINLARKGGYDSLTKAERFLAY